MKAERLTKEEISDDLNSIKVQIDALLVKRKEHFNIVADESENVSTIDANINMLREKGEILLGTKADRSEGRVKRLEEKPIDTKKTL